MVFRSLRGDGIERAVLRDIGTCRRAFGALGLSGGLARLCVLVAIAFLVSSFSAFAAGDELNRQKIRALDDPLWTDLQAVLLDAGRVELSPTPPYSDARIVAELDAVDPGRLSPPAEADRQRILAELAEVLPLRSGPLAGRIGIEAAPALEWRSSKSTPWILGYADREPLLSIPVELAFANSFYGYSALALKADPNLVAAGPLSPGGLNVAELAAAPIGIDATFPFRSFGSVGGDWWNFQIGRDRLSFGSAGPWNLTISQAAEFYDFARLSLFSPGFAYSGLVAQLDPERNLYLHRFDLRFGGGLSLGVTEASLVGTAPLELRYLNPFMIFHGFQAWSDYASQGVSSKEGSSNEVGIEVDWSPLPWLALSGQYVMNQISDPLKLFFWPSVSEIPNGEGWLASLKFRAPLEKEFIVATITGAYTTPTLYISPWSASNTAASAVLSDGVGSPISWAYDRPAKSNYASGSSQAWIGFSEGPDTILAALSAGLDAGSAWALLGDLAWKARGSMDRFGATNNWDTPSSPDSSNWSLLTPSGIAEYDLVAGLSARKALPSLPASFRGGLSGAIHWTGRWNANHVAGAFDQSWEIDSIMTIRFR